MEALFMFMMQMYGLFLKKQNKRRNTSHTAAFLPALVKAVK
jgi:nicotinamide riboside transporter PnuC